MHPEACIHPDAIQHNLNRVRSLAPKARVLAVIKADGYGHGLLRMARAMQTADGLAVARLSEGIQLRQAGIDSRIVVLQGFANHEELEGMLHHRLIPVVHAEFQLKIIADHSWPTESLHPVWIKVDTGMGRLGLSPEQFASLHPDTFRQAGYSVDCVMSHLACADEPGNPFTVEQLARFESLPGWPAEISLANSAALLDWSERFPQLSSGWVRPGLMLYGLSPFSDRTGTDLGLRPAMTLAAHVIAVRNKKKGEPVGYGGEWCCPEDMCIGVVSIGYGDGFPRHVQPGTCVWIDGGPAEIIGRVSMDMISIDLRQHPDVQVGDKVECWGPHLPVEILAAQSGTIPYELICQLTPRVQRIEGS
ncbi:MAG: alanine racemase [Gammaproteobacteria bacterium]|nr:MAG: alanine racemase [Gammaproteobacteria bacterium]